MPARNPRGSARGRAAHACVPASIQQAPHHHAHACAPPQPSHWHEAAAIRTSEASPPHPATHLPPLQALNQQQALSVAGVNTDTLLPLLNLSNLLAVQRLGGVQVCGGPSLQRSVRAQVRSKGACVGGCPPCMLTSSHAHLGRPWTVPLFAPFEEIATPSCPQPPTPPSLQEAAELLALKDGLRRGPGSAAGSGGGGPARGTGPLHNPLYKVGNWGWVVKPSKANLGGGSGRA